MLFGNDRNQLRRLYFDAWRNREADQQDALQRQICKVIAMHPEYQRMLEGDIENALAQDYSVEAGQTNPFLHMGMHIAIQEQVGTNRPQGIADLYRKALLTGATQHDIEHEFMESLGQAIWQAQRHGTEPDEAAYLTDLTQRVQRWLTPR